MPASISIDLLRDQGWSQADLEALGLLDAADLPTVGEEDTKPALGGKRRFVGLQAGYLLGTLSSYGERDAFQTLQHLIDAYNESRR